jgi:LysR family glycine cleavage system transcriptional activator
MLSRIPLKTIQAFEAAARLGSFALAADELLVTPSAISHQVKLLEDEIAVRLFHRINRGVVLTDAGRRYAEEVGAGLAQIARATRHIGQVTKSDILTIHSSPTFGTQWLMPRLARFSALNSDIDVRLNASTEPVDMVRDNVDIDIRYGNRLPTPGCVVLPFPAEVIFPLCAPGLLEGAHPLRNPSDLAHHVLIHSEGCLVGWRDWMRLHRDVRLEISRGPRFARSFMSIGAAVDGMGVCLESSLVAQRELAAGRLVAPFGMEGIRLQGYTLHSLRSQENLKKIRDFCNWLMPELAASISSLQERFAAPPPLP